MLPKFFETHTPSSCRELIEMVCLRVPLALDSVRFRLLQLFQNFSDPLMDYRRRRLDSQIEAGQQISPSVICGRCGSRASPDSTGTSPAPSAQNEVTGDRKTNGSTPRPSRREAEPQRRFPAWFAALSRHTGVSRDQPQEFKPRPAAGNQVKTRVPPGVGHGLRPLAKAGTAQRGEWPRSAASSGGHFVPEGAPLGGAWRSQAPTVNWPKSVVQTRSWPRGAASAGRRRSRCPAVTGLGTSHHTVCETDRQFSPLIHH